MANRDAKGSLRRTAPSPEAHDLPGIVIADGRYGLGAPRGSKISAFIWGGKVRPAPTLPYGRWKRSA